MSKKWSYGSILALPAMLAMSTLMAQSALAMEAMSDAELAKTEGQALVNLSYLAPTDPGSNSSVNGNVGFYRLGIEADMAVNLNIKKLQLGCGGVNGANGCDIDIDNLSLSGGSSGVKADGITPNSSSSDRVGSDAILSNPFVEFAIRNPNTASTREITGVRVSAEKVVGLLTTGLANTTTPNGINALSGYLKVQSRPGANTITGVLDTKPGFLDAGAFDKIGNPIHGSLDVYDPLLGIAGIANAKFHVSKGGFWIPGVKDVAFSANTSTLKGVRTDGSLTTTSGLINGNRISGIQVRPDRVNLPDAILGFNPPNDTGCGALSGAFTCNNYGASSGFVTPDNYPYTVDANGYPQYTGSGKNGVNASAFQSVTNPYLLTQGGPVEATVDSCSVLGIPNGCTLIGVNSGTKLGVNMFGKIHGLFADVTFQQSLGMIHSLAVNSPLSLSLQGAALRWPGANADDIAQPGWWLSLSDPVYLGDLLPSNPIDLCPGGITGPTSACAYPQFIDQANTFFQNPNNNPKAYDIGAIILRNKNLAVPISDQNGVILPNGFQLTLSDVQLATQNFAPNCYGGLTFC